VRRKLTRFAAVGGLALFLVVAMGGAAFADTGPSTTTLSVDMNLLWVVIGGALVMFMQAGFALVETGFTRAKNAAHTMTMNVAIYGTAFAAFMLVGYPLMFGGYTNSLIGLDKPFGSALIGHGESVLLWGGPIALSGKAYAAPALAFFFFSAAFMDATATIPTGAMAERWKWNNFVVWGLFCGALYYPLFGAWTWGGGWLAQLGNSHDLGFGYVDFAGSGVVHAMGGVAALAGAMVLGPRIGKYGKDGKARAIPGHNLTLALTGVMILLFGWFGFNGASTLAATDIRFATVVANTTISAAFGTLVAMLYVMKRLGKPDPSMIGNGLLAGLVAITAPCAFVSPIGAAIIGSIAAILVVEGVLLVERLHVDDPVGAVAVHGINGLWGVLAVGLFADGQYGQSWNLTDHGKQGVTGIFGGDFTLGLHQLESQVIGCIVLCTVFFGIAFAFFKISNAVMKGGIRSDEETERGGLDLHDMGVAAYTDDTLTGGH
jgi:Amt family ammonium transporter